VAFAVFLGCPQTDSPTGKEEPQTVTLPTLTVSSARATITRQSDSIYAVSITIPNGATTGQIGLTDGANFSFKDKTFNVNIIFISGTYDKDGQDAIVDEIKRKFVEKGVLADKINTTITTIEQLPSLTIGGTPATINKQSEGVYNVTIDVPAGATEGQINFTNTSSFTFEGKTFNFYISLAYGEMDSPIVSAITGKFAGATINVTKSERERPQQPTITPPTLKIDGMSITIPVPAEGVNTISISATVSNGEVVDFADPSGVLTGKVVNLNLSAAAGQNNRINYNAIKEIEQAFKTKGVDAVSSDTAGGAIPVFNVIRDGGSITALALRATAQDQTVKLVNNISAIYNNGNPILKVESPIQLIGTTLCTEVMKIQANASMVYADECLRLASGYSNVREITLLNLLGVYTQCGFRLDNTNNFFPKLGSISTNDGSELSLNIIEPMKSWDIYRLFERYHAAGKLNNLMELNATGITVTGENVTGLYNPNNQPSASFPYKVNGQIIGFMVQNNWFKGYENLYETGGLSIPSGFYGSNDGLKIKNCAITSQLNVPVYAEGGCFFQYAPAVVNSTGALKIMRVTNNSVVSALYLDLRDLPTGDKAFLNGGATEMAFPSPHMMFTEVNQGFFPWQIGYANDSGVTKLIGTIEEGFNPSHASSRNSGIYGVLKLQDWTVAIPNPNKNTNSFSSNEKWVALAFNNALSFLKFGPTTEQNPALFPLGNPLLAAILERKQRDMEIS
jgi:hypothetical protein